jgi:hypothetical protein
VPLINPYNVYRSLKRPWSRFDSDNNSSIFSIRKYGPSLAFCSPLLILGLISNTLLAQEADSLQIKSYVDKIILKINLDTQNEEFLIFSDQQEQIALSTNNSLRLDLSLDYEFLGFSIGFAPNFFNSNKDDARKGSSELTDIGFRFFLGRWTQELTYQSNEGFYVENTADFIADWNANSDPYIQFPDLKRTYYGGSTAYVLNDRFSLRNIVYNTEWQLKSAGSFVPTARYGYRRISATLNQTREIENNFELDLIAAYYYTWVIHANWFIAPQLSPGIGIRFSNTTQENTTARERDTRYPLILDGGLQLGYSSERFIAGGLLNFQSIYTKTGSGSSVINDQVFARFFVGIRLDPPEFIAKQARRINEKFGQ